MDKTGRNGIRFRDLFSDGWKKKYSKLKNKHLNLINNLNVDISFNLENWKKYFLKV